MCIDYLIRCDNNKRVFYKVVIRDQHGFYYSPVAGTYLGKLGEIVDANFLDSDFSTLEKRDNSALMEGWMIAQNKLSHRHAISVFLSKDRAIYIAAKNEPVNDNLRLVVLKIRRMNYKSYFVGTEGSTYVNLVNAALLTKIKLEKEIYVNIGEEE